MHDSRKRHGTAPTSTTGAERDAASKAGDRGSDALRRTASRVGNEELQQRIQKGNASRDELLQFLLERLRTIREVQQREVGLSDQRSTREHWKQIADKGKADITAPDPTRWREAARIYEEAAAQLARGALGRGADLVERAMDVEKKTFDSLTSLVKPEDVERDLDGPDRPSALDAVDPGQACAAAALPTEIRDLAREIQHVTEKPEEVPNRRRVRDPWWTEEEEEEEEEGEGA
jgi:hypothetical protein